MPGGTAISIQNVSKRYQIGVLRHDTLRDQIAHSFQGLFSRRRSQDNAGNNSSGILWALREVAFDVYHGEVVGLIGRNGAGKSTLLKILAHITEPTTGRVELYGRIGSLLEVGTGFHPELSGRENIYMNGAILGMSRKEIEVKFDQILDFAEIHKFIDTPVKRYSSGMYVRLAFAVAAHLEPEILLVDEVLAVGDAAFQRKCLGKMSDIASEGRTVVFVSHNMSAIQTLCRRGIYLNEGRVAMDGEIDQVAAYYLSTLEQFAAVDLTERSDRSGRGLIRLLDVKISSPGEWDSNTLATGRPAQFTFFVTEARPGLACTFTIFDYKGTPICNFRSALSGPGDLVTSEIGNAVVCTIDELLLLPGQYRINVGLRSNDVLEDRVEAAAYFIVEQGQLHGRPAPLDNKFGSAIMPHHWQLPA